MKKFSWPDSLFPEPGARKIPRSDVFETNCHNIRPNIMSELVKTIPDS